MRFYGPRSIATPARMVLDVLLTIAGLLVAGELVVTAVLLVNPVHPLREFFQVTTVVAVPATAWPLEDVVRVDPGIATASVEPWAYLTYHPVSRSFVAAASVASLAWWACAMLMLLQLRRAFVNIEAGSPFPRTNVRCIRTAGLGLLGMAAVQFLADLFVLTNIWPVTTVAGRPPTIPTVLILLDFPLASLLGGTVVLFVAEIYRAGADLQDDQALTV